MKKNIINKSNINYTKSKWLRQFMWPRNNCQSTFQLLLDCSGFLFEVMLIAIIQTTEGYNVSKFIANLKQEIYFFNIDEQFV